ncbi:anthranilate synthase component I family protein [Halobaculum rubrum]|uniref:anthranilate synthase component I family protein n=1 Tax=Halobaculum rubrum TaxID=2872158 RepID=UPI001CA3F59A|nr:anthranilate synthase component I family protein [Halobaculum rubrum]QZY00583.1 anthranilate synthase component I family protein [Halobaculum rubrum]
METVTDREAFRRLAVDAPADARIPVERRVAVDDPFDAYRRARRGDRSGVFYETTGGQPGWGYFGVDPAETLTVGPDAAVRDPDHPGHGDYAAPSPTLSALEGLLDSGTLVRGDCDVPYPCGAFGWLSYDVARELESFPHDGAVDDRGLPRLQAAVYPTLASWAEPRTDGTTTLRITSCPRLDDHPGADAAYEAGLAAAGDLARRARTGDPSVAPAPAAGADAASATFESDCGREAYAERVRRVKESIRAGDTFQANVSQRLAAPAAVHPVTAYAALRARNPAPYSGLVEFPGVDLVSASPELLLRRVPGADPDGDGNVETDDREDGARLETEPIAGTRPRGGDPEADAAQEAELAGDEKERAEHAMLVDLERNDLGKVSEYGSVSVPEYRRVDRYSEVMHLVSLVEGTERPDRSLADTLAAVSPGGTITGAPKPKTMAIIDALEGTRRGPYTGSMFAAGLDGRLVANIVIRTLVRTDDEYHLRVGAGVVHDSDPNAEYEETLAKARALVRSVDDALDADMAVEGDGTGGEKRDAEGRDTAERDTAERDTGGDE